MVAATGGLEVASDRLLKLMEKGVTIDQVVRCAAAFQGAGVLVHAYLMYGFPTETMQEGIDAMEVVRQMFVAGIVDSAFWHRFVLTTHSGIAQEPERYSLTVASEGSRFATNDLPHDDGSGVEHDIFDHPLSVSLSAWMRGEELDRPCKEWFEVGEVVPSSRVEPNRIDSALNTSQASMKQTNRLVWLGGEPMEVEGGIELYGLSGQTCLRASDEEVRWLVAVIEGAAPGSAELTYGDAVASFPGDWSEFKRSWREVRAAGLVGV
jgi:hypothetical protein